jgi:hypothetical protein
MELRIWWLKPAASRPRLTMRSAIIMLRSTDIFSCSNWSRSAATMKNSKPCRSVQFQLRGIPRLADVFVNRAVVDGLDRGVHVGERGDEDAQDARAELARVFQQPDALLAGHPLVGHQNPDFAAVFLEELQPVLRAGGGVNAERVAEGAGETHQRLLLVVHIEDGEFFIVV